MGCIHKPSVWVRVYFSSFEWTEEECGSLYGTWKVLQLCEQLEAEILVYRGLLAKWWHTANELALLLVFLVAFIRS